MSSTPSPLTPSSIPPSPPSSTARSSVSGLRAGGRQHEWDADRGVSWVLLDIDGTLLGPTGTVTDAVAQAVQDAVAAGVRVGYATGRNVAGIADVHGRLGLEGPHVVLNGAQVRQGGGALHTWPLSPSELDGLLTLCREEGHYAELYTDEGFWVTRVDEVYRPHWDLVIGQPLGVIDPAGPPPWQVIKATVVTLDDAQRDHVVAALRRLDLNAGVATSPVTPQLTYVNTTAADVDKGQAVRTAAEAIGVHLDDVVVIGDGANDLPLLAVAGTAVAMGGAPPEVLAAAHLVTAAVEEDGVAVALRALLDPDRPGSDVQHSRDGGAIAHPG